MSTYFTLRPPAKSCHHTSCPSKIDRSVNKSLPSLALICYLRWDLRSLGLIQADRAETRNSAVVKIHLCIVTTLKLVFLSEISTTIFSPLFYAHCKSLLTLFANFRMSSGSGLPPSQHAAFAVISRLLSCLITERLLRGLYTAIPGLPEVSGVLVVLSTHLTLEKTTIDRALRPNDIFAIVPLRHPPVLNGTGGSEHGRSVSLVDPFDMFPEIYECPETSSEDSGQVHTVHP